MQQLEPASSKYNVYQILKHQSSVPGALPPNTWVTALRVAALRHTIFRTMFKRDELSGELMQVGSRARMHA